MSTRNNNVQKNKLFIESITTSDTISQFMEKCNNNFSAIVEYGGGPDGEKGDKGDQGVPTKPKVPIHVWIKDVDYDNEEVFKIGNEIKYKINGWIEDELYNSKYQAGHLILLENGHVYILEVDDNFNLKPEYICGIQSYDPGTVIDGKDSYVHFAYSDYPDGRYLTIINNKNYINNGAIFKPYIGVYCDNFENAQPRPELYTWIRLGVTYNVLLSNPIYIIPTVEENNKIYANVNVDKEYSTFVYLYDNTSDITYNDNVEIKINNNNNNHFKINGNKIIFNPIADDGTIFEFR